MPPCFLFTRAVVPTDDAHTVFSKKIMVIATLCIFIVDSFLLLHDSLPHVWWRRLFISVVSLVVFLQMMLERRLRTGVISVWMYLMGAVLVVSDLDLIVEGNHTRTWPSFVLLVDICLVSRLDSRVATGLIFMIVTWLFITFFENAYRFGLYDLSFLESQEDRRSRVDCAEIPCAIGFSLSTELFAGQVAVFLLDFYFTRGFAHGLRKEHDKMNKVIAATEDIATSLSRFDLVSAKAIISTASLPPPLYDAFSTILENLKDYRPYLPDALFHSMHSESYAHRKDIPAPGLQSQNASLVFTDIQGSTATWEACPEGMKEGLQVHNQAIRDCIAEHNGYEVKTIGDAFMVAFESTSDAVWFGLSVQERLVNSVWPEELLDLESCKRKSEGPWCGLRVRVGVHCGDVSVQLNNLTGRYDYFGNTVNKAARMEGACVGGAVAVTPEVMEAAGPLDSVSVIPMGQTELKGVGGSINPFLLLPRSLLGRTSFVEQHLLNRTEGKLCVSDNTLLPRIVSMHGSEQTISSQGSSTSMLNLFQQSTSATIGKVEVVLGSYDSSASVAMVMNAGLAKILTCTERSHGAVVSLQGNQVQVSWNCTKPCSTHVENAFVFVKMLGVSSWSEAMISMGISTSKVYHGTVGGNRQKFMTVLGTGVVVSSSLCSDAVANNVLCYYASVFDLAEMQGLSMKNSSPYATPDGTHMKRVELAVYDDASTLVRSLSGQ